MKKRLVFACLVISLVGFGSLLGQDKKYYLSESGNDSNDGSTIKTAWRTLDKINGIDFEPGDSILLEGGNRFNGTIKLSFDDNGSAAKPVVFTSFGRGKATINAGEGEGLLAINTSFLKIFSLQFEGAGVPANQGSGIHFYANDSIKAPSEIEITDCDVSGFNSYGIVFGANDKISHSGYQQVRITHCNTSENGQAGISSYGSQLGFQHRNFYVANCKAFRNRGIPGKTENHSGNGIVMAMVDGLLIEHCEAYENGADNRCTAGGPVGIWVWMCKNAVIQYCISHDNYAGLTKDGGGFDIDGGSSNCVVQYNYSYNNEGAGYLLAEFGALFPFTNNTIRFNISFNDGRKNGYGSISIWGVSGEHSVTNTHIYNNTIFVDDQHIVNGIPAGIALIGPNFKNVILANNIFATKGNVNMIHADTVVNESAILLLHNNYYSFSNQYNLLWGKKKFHSLRGWFLANPTQEIKKGKSLWMNINPLFRDQKYLIARSPNISGRYLMKEGLVLLSASGLRKKTFELHDYFNIPSNTKDYCSKYLMPDGNVIPGACTE